MTADVRCAGLAVEAGVADARRMSSDVDRLGSAEVILALLPAG
jgi:hypothetical protein